MSDPIYSECPPASLTRQLAAMIYDSLLIFAVLLLAVTIVVVFNHGEAVTGNVWLLRLYLFLTVFTYYAWFWKKSGQTLGMRVWKIRIVTESGANPGWGISYLRLLCALVSLLCFGLGYLWRLFKPYTWHDRLSHTRIINISSLAPGKKQPGADPE